MAAERVEVRYDGGLASVAMVKGYSVTIVGSHSIWSWFIELDRHGVVDGMERDFDAAMIAADNEAHRLTDDSGDM